MSFTRGFLRARPTIPWPCCDCIIAGTIRRRPPHGGSHKDRACIVVDIDITIDSEEKACKREQKTEGVDGAHIALPN